VLANRTRETLNALGCVCEVHADLVTAEAAGLAAFGESNTGPDQETLDARDSGVHCLGNFAVAHRVHLPQKQCGALSLGKPAYIGDHIAELLTVFDVFVRRYAIHEGVHVHRVLTVRNRLAQVIQRAVTSYPVEPWLDIDRPLVGDHCVVGGNKHLLQNVLGVFSRAEHLTAEAEQATLIAGDESFECRLMSLTGQGNEILIAFETEKR
jgi:hypothetical protein